MNYIKSFQMFESSLESTNLIEKVKEILDIREEAEAILDDVLDIIEDPKINSSVNSSSDPKLRQFFSKLKKMAKKAQTSDDDLEDLKYELEDEIANLESGKG